MAKQSQTRAKSKNEMRNPLHRVSRETRQTLDLVHRLQMEELEQRQRATMLVRKGSERERRLNQRVQEWVRTGIPELDREVAAIREKYTSDVQAADKLRPSRVIYDIKPSEMDWHPPVPNGDGGFWWASTDAWGSGGIQVVFLTDGLHFFDSIGYNGDPLVSFSAGAVAHFELHANRRPPSASGRYASAPIVELFGKIEGFTGYWHWLWAADDKWSKCWLNLRQTALQLVPHDFGVPGYRSVLQPVVLAERKEVRNLIDEENEGRFKDAFLQGFTPMPPIEFGLVNPNLSIWVQLEVRFDIQLEGWSHIKFSPEPNPMGSVLLRHFQWKIQPL